MELRSAYIFDLDGTLANLDHRLHWIQGKPKLWSRFFAEVHNDTPIPAVISLARRLSDSSPPTDILICSGRTSDTRDATCNWLNNYNVPYNALHMRGAGDFRADHIVKQELYETEIKPYYSVMGVFDDRDQVVRMWRRLGLQCYQVNEGDF